MYLWIQNEPLGRQITYKYEKNQAGNNFLGEKRAERAIDKQMPQCLFYRKKMAKC